MLILCRQQVYHMLNKHKQVICDCQKRDCGLLDFVRFWVPVKVLPKSVTVYACQDMDGSSYQGTCSLVTEIQDTSWRLQVISPIVSI